MAREIITSIWCDLCLDVDGTKQEATELPPISVSGRPAKALALCDGHNTEVAERFLNALEEYGATIDNTSPARSPRPRHEPDGYENPETCPDCGREYANLQSLRGHVKNAHGMTVADIRRKHGIPHRTRGWNKRRTEVA